MAVNRILFGEGPDGDFAIGGSATFDIQLQPKILENNTVSAVEIALTIEGDLIAGTPQAVADALVEVTELASEATGPTRIRIEIDGVVKYDFSPAAMLVGPFVTLAETVPSPGNAAGHWRYRLQAALRQPKPGGDLTSDVQTSLSVVTVNGTVTRKMWRATAKGKSVTEALNKVMSFKPAETKVTEEIERYFQESRATAIWTWEPRRTDLIHKINEHVKVTGGGVDYVVDKQAGKTTPPLLFLAQQEPWMVTIEGIVFGFDKSITAPKPHFTESATLRRLTARESNADKPEVENEKTGLYRLAYMEVWVCTAAVLPKLDHGDHDTIVVITPPADGSMAS